MSATDNNTAEGGTMNGYMKTIYVGDYSVNIWVKNADTHAERVQNEAEAIAIDFNRVLAQYGMRCAQI